MEIYSNKSFSCSMLSFHSNLAMGFISLYMFKFLRQNYKIIPTCIATSGEFVNNRVCFSNQNLL